MAKPDIDRQIGALKVQQDELAAGQTAACSRSDSICASLDAINSRIDNLPPPPVIPPIPPFDPWTSVFKASDESRNTTTTFADDAALKFAMLANKKYSFRGCIVIKGVAAGGFKARFVGPASPNDYAALAINSIGSINGSGINDYVSNLITISTIGAGLGVMHFFGHCANGATAGNLVLQWAQNASNAAATAVKAGSYIESAVMP